MNTVFVYSGTGNSLASAKQIADGLEMEMVHITDELANSDSLFQGERGIVIYPVYAYGMPKTVKRFIKKNKFQFDYLAVLTTIGSSSGGAFAEAIKLFKKRKQKVHFTDQILSVENFVHMFKLPDEEKIVVLQEGQKQKNAQLIEDLKQQKTNKRCMFRPESSFVSALFRSVTKMFAKRYKITEECNGCRVCYKVCPALAIEMQEIEKPESEHNITNQRPNFVPKKCDHCQACMQLCPKHAIQFGKIQPESRRYCHVDVKTSELFKRD